MLKTITDFFAEERRAWIDSLRGLRSLRAQTLSAMLLALTVVLDYVGGFYLTPTIKLTVSYLGVALTGALLGPISAMLNGALCDVLMWVIKPAGAYFPGYTLSGLLGGLIYGVCLYKRSGRGMYIGAALSKLLVNLLINIGLNTCWSAMFTGKAYLILLPTRALKNAAALVPEIILLILVLLALEKSGVKKRIGR